MTSREKDATVLPFAPSAAPPDALRAMLRQLVHDVLETEFAGLVGAARFERTAERRGVRNGYRTRRLTTRVGAIELRVPRDRAGEFQPSLFARYQRREQALVAARAERYVQGVSTRKVSAVVEQLCGETVSASTVSAMAASLDASLAGGKAAPWRARPLTAKAYPSLVVDAHVERVRREGQVAVHGRAVGDRRGRGRAYALATASTWASGSARASRPRAGAPCSRTWSSAG